MTGAVFATGVTPPSPAPEQVASSFDHGRLEADLAHVDERDPGLAAFVAQLSASPSNPGGGLAEFGS